MNPFVWCSLNNVNLHVCADPHDPWSLGCLMEKNGQRELLVLPSCVFLSSNWLRFILFLFIALIGYWQFSSISVKLSSVSINLFPNSNLRMKASLTKILIITSWKNLSKNYPLGHIMNPKKMSVSINFFKILSFRVICYIAMYY
jgi:hypothetical protein